MTEIYRMSLICLLFLLPFGLQAGGGEEEAGNINLIYAEGKIFYHEVVVQWSTGFERGTGEFLIEAARADKKEWTLRGRMKTNGKGEKHLDYSFKDSRDDQYRYYRIRVIDGSGTYVLREFEPLNYSISVNLTNVQLSEDDKRLAIEYNIDQDQEIMVRIFNRIGEQVATRLMPFTERGDYIYQLDISNLKKGNYLLVVTQTLLDKSVAEKQFTVD